MHIKRLAGRETVQDWRLPIFLRGGLAVCTAMATTVVAVKEWLDAVKPGYGALYASAFSETGIDDAGDVGGMTADLDLMGELEMALEELGAKSGHLRNIRNAIAQEGVKMSPHRPGGPSRSDPSPQLPRRLGGHDGLDAGA